MNVSSSQVLEAYDHLLLDTTTLLHKNGTDLPLFSGSTFPTFLWLGEPEFSVKNGINPATSGAVYSTLQSLLAIPLYHCQTGVARRLIPSITDAKSASNPGLDFIFSTLSPLPERDSPATFAHHRYEISVSRSTLIAYIVLSGVTLLICCIAQAAVSITNTRSGGRHAPSLTPFPAFDLFAHCTIEDEEQRVLYQGRSGALLYDTKQRSLLSWLSTLSVKYARPPGAEEGLQLFGLQGFQAGKQDDSQSRLKSPLYPSSNQSTSSLDGTGPRPYHSVDHFT
jgi:hypothetical protein